MATYFGIRPSRVVEKCKYEVARTPTFWNRWRAVQHSLRVHPADLTCVFVCHPLPLCVHVSPLVFLIQSYEGSHCMTPANPGPQHTPNPAQVTARPRPGAMDPVQALREVVELVRCATDREAINLGIWLHETLALMAHWRVLPCTLAYPTSTSSHGSLNMLRDECV